MMIIVTIIIIIEHANSKDTSPDLTEWEEMPSLTEPNPTDNLGHVKVSQQTNADKCD
jgi:hypothetical protein